VNTLAGSDYIRRFIFTMASYNLISMLLLGGLRFKELSELHIVYSSFN